MQNAKDTFYITLRDRIAALNPARTVLVRGQLRPALLVEENELSSTFSHDDTFVLRWADTKIDAQQDALPLVAQRCEIRYATQGSSGNGGMDRGRLLSAMDSELAAALNAAPQRATKISYAGAATPMQTSIFWGDIALSPMQTAEGRPGRMATVNVFSYQEAGER
ncbi:MAG: hypothetical protein JST61_11355 [Acidobacteria bacterium]|nr:hypothetical protein [Acidobacteriota bacterium]